MKQILVLLLCISASFISFAQPKYEIYKIQGDVFLKHASKTSWEKATVFTVVTPNDIINLKKGCSITILEKRSGRLYSFPEKGSISVQRRLYDAQKKEQSLFSALNRELQKAVSKNRNNYKPRPVYSASANGVRGSGSRNTYSIYDSIYANILFLCQTQTSTTDTAIIAEKHYNADSSFFITIQNNTDKTLFCNLLHIKDNKIAPCFFFGDFGFLTLPPDFAANLSALPLSTDNGLYILIASEICLSNQSMLSTFSTSSILKPSNIPAITLIKL